MQLALLFQKRNPGSGLWPDILFTQTQTHTYTSLTPENETDARATI
jgi:hypothetical protein